MPEENYINIYATYLGELLKDHNLAPLRFRDMLNLFLPYLETVKSREDFIKFINRNLRKFPELETLKQRLLDKNYQFPIPDLNQLSK